MKKIQVVGEQTHSYLPAIHIKQMLHIFILLFGLSTAVITQAGTPDEETPAQENVCDGLSNAAYGLCNAYCEAQDCDTNPKQSCESLRGTYEALTGSPVFPCDVPPTCEELNPTQEQIDAVVAEVVTDIANPWGNVGDFQLLLDRMQEKLRCTLNEQDPVASVQSLLPQSAGACAAPGVNYCGPGNSETGTTLGTGSACLNEACCKHDECYGVNCVDGECYWTTQTQACDTALRNVCDGNNCSLDIRGKIICAIVRQLDDREDPSSKPQCANPPSCATGSDPDCIGQTCDSFTTCNPGSGCASPVCGSIAEGGGLCIEGTTQCAGLATCTSTADCGGSGLCFVDSCCGRGVCVPANAFCPDIGASSSTQSSPSLQIQTTDSLLKTGPTVGCR